MRQLLRTVLWRRLRKPGLEYCTLSKNDEGWQLDGTVILADNDYPLFVRYQVLCTITWNTRLANLELQMGATEQSLQIIADGQRRWKVAGKEISALRGCEDIDLSITPSTNTIPIRRLDLRVGNSRKVKAAWLHFPDLVIQPLQQKYTRVAKNLYRYESRNGKFVAEIDVDDLGLVTYYPNVWKREAGANGSPAESRQ